MPQSSVAAACRSWNPPLPTDTAPVLAPTPLFQAALAGTCPATKCQLPLFVYQGVVTQLRQKRWHPLGQWKEA